MSRVLPILFNTEMVRAILDERKICTRRLIKHNVDAVLNSPYHKEHPEVEDKQIISKLCQPPYQPGDILYVRETVWQKTGHYLDVDGETKPSWYNEFRYVASDEKPGIGWNYSWVKRPSIHMPKEAARIWLKVTDVRVERLQDITSEQICREGVEVEYPHVLNGEEKRYAFSALWNSTIKKADLDRYGWSANPWVWVIEFERCEKPEGV